jgi:hypothetical protein
MMMARLARLRDGVMRRYFRWRAVWDVQRAAQVLHGPARVALGKDDCAVVSLMKDAAWYVGPFIRHHQAQGVRHILIVDNGSSDDTVAIASRFANVTVVRNTLLAKTYECLLRSQMARKVFQGGWLLFVDSDELFEAPFANGPAFPRLTAYLNAQGYTAMATQMLDHFSGYSYATSRGFDYDTTIAAFDQYALGEIVKAPYHDRDLIGFNWFVRDNKCEAAVQWQIGGLRHEVFGEDCVLTKHSLVRNAKGIEAMTHPHCATGVVLADVTGVLRHYKLGGDYLDRDRRNLMRGVWDHAEDAKRIAAAGAGDDFVITPAKSRTWRGPDALVSQGFLIASERYRRFMAQK